MRANRGRTKLVCLLAAVVTIGAIAATAGPAAAATTPPWDVSNPNALGTLSFFDASGNPVTGGDDLSHLADYILASTTDPSTKPGTLAQLVFANPQNGLPTASFHTTLDEQTSFPNAAAPGALGTTSNPLVSLDSSGADLFDAVAGFDTTNPVPGFANVYQLRVFTSGPNAAGSHATAYWDADVQIDPQAGTWVEVYPTGGSAPTATTTTLAVSPPSSAAQHAQVAVTATETAADTTHPTGTVEIDDGNQVLGSGSADGSGQFTVTTSNLLPGSHSFTATFTPTASGFSGSTSSATSYLIDPIAAKPKITGTVQAGKSVTCKETLTSGEKASYAWDAAGKSIGSGKTLTVPGSAVGKSLTCRATVKVSGGTPSSATSAGKTVAKGAALKSTKAPTLSGPGKVGKTEKVKAGKWSPSTSSFSYQWLLNGKKIKHATKSSYKLVKKDKGKKISCQVTAKKTGFAPGTATSKSVKVKG